MYLSVRPNSLSCFAASGIVDKHLSLVCTCHVFGTVYILQILAMCLLFLCRMSVNVTHFNGIACVWLAMKLLPVFLSFPRFVS